MQGDSEKMKEEYGQGPMVNPKKRNGFMTKTKDQYAVKRKPYTSSFW